MENFEKNIPAVAAVEKAEGETGVEVPQDPVLKSIEEADGGGGIGATAQEDRSSSSAKAALLGEEIKSGSGSGRLSRLLKAFALGATLIAGNPAQADVVPDAPRPEASKKDEQGAEKEMTFSGRVTHPELGTFTIEVFQTNNPDSDGSLRAEETTIKINGRERAVKGALKFRAPGAPGTSYVIESSDGGTNETIRLHRSGSTYFTKDASGKSLELPIVQ